ncbi:uncharacterized protein PV07_12229 [Cladophialophora immunda]|uniref:Methyltransferase domain-containing protein n=1 Tax=Cladophialophora immunda TaxID=569365 RepID=A0A0D2ABZ8_9EURO|nr:uncharacterized protein PV07_12229 [Cladophialophora immunda]KIW22332.1 hypothetical protein PV07_12229 [Cladophialophora immunda]
MPNDCAERERLELQHCAMFLAAGAQLFYASVKRLQKILDLGAGTGTWANDVADAHLEAIVLGVDLSTIQPTVAPPNATWEIDDVEDDWTWPPDHFNLIQPVQAQWKHRRFPKVFSTGFQVISPAIPPIPKHTLHLTLVLLCVDTAGQGATSRFAIWPHTCKATTLRLASTTQWTSGVV